METFIIVAAILMLVWAFLTGLVFVDTWTQTKEDGEGLESMESYLKTIKASLAEIRAGGRRSVVPAKADYIRARGFEEDAEEVKVSFGGF